VTSREDRDDFRALLAQIPLEEAAKRDLSAMMGAPERFYHGVGHLALLWRRHRLYAAEAGLTAPEWERLIACAIAYHDCVNEGGRHDNEQRSAEVWLRASARSGLSDEDRNWVADTIRATSDHLAYPNATKASPSEQARLWMLDLDLTPLGETAADFDRNTELLRREVPHLTESEWDAGRLSFLRRFAAAPQIYRTPALAAVFEVQARANIARQLPAG
jgi:predicted metal-dependent HD superfamily phosphohydrolase